MNEPSNHGTGTGDDFSDELISDLEDLANAAAEDIHRARCSAAEPVAVIDEEDVRLLRAVTRWMRRRP